ncbi:integrase core domain-containing protein [Thermus scotoductus]|jgi:transposase|nr:integrase core domain-containing protein [Thermus scotoductus]
MNRLAHVQLARHRLKLCQAREGGRSFREVARQYGVSVSTAWKWAKRYEEGHRAFEALYNRPNAPRNPRTRRDLDEKVKELWEKGLRGARLRQALEAEGLKASYTAIYNALKRLGLHKPRKRKPKKRHHVDLPFGWVQADVLYLGPEGPYQFTAVEAETRLQFARIYPEITPQAAVDFVARALAFFPFPVRVLATDHGTEWTYAALAHVKKEHPLEGLLRERGVRQVLIPVGAPRYNGRVERAHRTAREEFYSWAQGEASRYFLSWLKVYNERRGHMALGWKTPKAKAEELLGRPVALDYSLAGPAP